MTSSSNLSIHRFTRTTTTHTMNAGFSAELAAEMKKLMEKHSNDMENLKEEMAKAISAKEEALQKELEAERTKMQKQMIKLEEQKKALADGLTAAREGADRKLHEQAADFDRRVKETEESAQEEQKKLIAELDKILSEKAAADTKLKDSEKMARAQTRQKLQHIRSLLDAAQKEKEGAYRKHLDLLRSVRAQICHWESFSGTFHSASFNPAPIEYGGVHRENGHSFVIRVKERLKDPGKESITVWIQDVQEGDSLQTTHSVYASQEHQVLVGDPSRLLWVSLHGRFKVKSIGYNPVPGWNEEVGGVSDTLFIARFSHSGNVYLAGVEEGDDDVSCKSSGYPQIRAQDYEVLCYKDL
ncbi:hypothetical protein B0H14DRAFT_2887197 [Mycena olivaceomarginata]|nr:hypothetical protein B0H14DRAFT_2887197 [Mycena olivaceomarginata]